VSKPDLMALWVKFGGGPKTEAEAQRRREIAALLDGTGGMRDEWPPEPELKALLAEVERARATPSVAASAIRIVAGAKVTRGGGDYCPQSVWLAIQAQQRARTEGQA
jgi:hypothetical protein